MRAPFGTAPGDGVNEMIASLHPGRETCVVRARSQEFTHGLGTAVISLTQFINN